MESVLPVIIDQDTFKRVQLLLKERAFVITHPKRVVSNYFLSGLGALGQTKFELFINLWTLGLGIALIVFLWPRLALV